MTRWSSLLEEIPAEPERLLEVLAELARSGATPLPTVTLHLRTGRDLAGIVVDRRLSQRAGGAATWVIQTASHERFADDLTFIAVSQVEAVTLHGASALGKVLEGRKPPPTALELQRMAKDAEQQLAAVIGKALRVQLDVDKGADARGTAQLIKRTTSALKAIASDNLGKEALAALSHVQVAIGAQLAASKEGGGVVLRGPVSPEDQLASEDAIKGALETVL